MVKRDGEGTLFLVGKQIGHPYSLAFAWHHFGWLQQYFKLGKAVQTSAETALAIAAEQGFPFWKATGSLCRASTSRTWAKNSSCSSAVRLSIASASAGAPISRRYLGRDCSPKSTAVIAGLDPAIHHARPFLCRE